MESYNIILKPLLSEKITELSEKYNRYGFLVATNANKNQIRDAIESIYDVRVLDVKTILLPGKTRRFGRHSYKTNKKKKALVRLEEGQKIEFFKDI